MSARSSAKERTVAWGLFGLLVVGVAASFVASGDETVVRSDTPTTGADVEAGVPDGPRSFTIAASGDLLIHESVAAAAEFDGGWDFRPMFASVAPIISAADLAVCHIESPMSPDNTNLAYFPSFNVPNSLADAIAEVGYDTCSLASNHSLDTGTTGVEGTITALDRVGVAHHGMARDAAERDEGNLLDVRGVTVAHLSYAYGFNTGDLPVDAPWLSNVIDEATILADAATARAAGAEFVIVSLHWGTQYVTEPDELQTTVGPAVLASPAVDLVLGHHAHVVQPLTAIGGEYLAYGMGNFLSNQSPESCSGCPDGTQDGVILGFTVEEGEDGTFSVTDAVHTPTWVDRTSYEIVPVLAAPGERDETVMAASAERTALALASLGVAVPT